MRSELRHPRGASRSGCSREDGDGRSGRKSKSSSTSTRPSAFLGSDQGGEKAGSSWADLLDSNSSRRLRATMVVKDMSHNQTTPFLDQETRGKQKSRRDSLAPSTSTSTRLLCLGRSVIGLDPCVCFNTGLRLFSSPCSCSASRYLSSSGLVSLDSERGRFKPNGRSSSS